MWKNASTRPFLQHFLHFHKEIALHCERLDTRRAVALLALVAGSGVAHLPDYPPAEQLSE